MFKKMQMSMEIPMVEMEDIYEEPYHWKMKGLWKYIALKRFELAEGHINKNSMVLDIGCGDGFLTNEISKRCNKVLGIDPSFKGLKFAQHKIAHKNFYPVCGSGDLIPFKDCSFDVITMFEVIEHIPVKDISNLIEEIRRCLKDTGALIITTPNRKSLRNRMLKIEKTSQKHEKEYTVSELINLFNMFEVKITKGIFLAPPININGISKYPFFGKLYDKLIDLGETLPNYSHCIFMVLKNTKKPG